MLNDFLMGGYALLALLLTVAEVATLTLMLYSWRRAETTPDIDLVAEERAALTRPLFFSLIVPARHEASVLPVTLARLMKIRYEHFEVLVVVGDDDPDTARAALRVAARHPERVRVITDENEVKSKPKALNTALPHCRGDVVGVFDAEDFVHPDLLQRVESRMVLDGCAALQAGVQLMNFWSSWYAVRNAMEYYFYFRSRLLFHADSGFVPLGGNTVFIRRPLLFALGGWDPECLAEDCELGVRLSSRGYRISVIYEPDLVTREEAPGSVREFVRQRTRWNQGFLQVLFKGEWKLLPPRRRALAVLVLASPFLQAAIALSVPLAIFTIVRASFPTVLALASYVPLIPGLAILAAEHVALVEFGRTYGRRAKWRDHVRLALGFPAYQGLLALSSLRALLRQLRQDTSWDKTSHAGLHLEPTLEPQAVS